LEPIKSQVLNKQIIPKYLPGRDGEERVLDEAIENDTNKNKNLKY